MKIDKGHPCTPTPPPEPAPYEPITKPASYGSTCPDDDPKIKGRYLKIPCKKLGVMYKPHHHFFHIFDPPSFNVAIFIIM